MVKHAVLASVFVLAIASATAQEAPPSHAVGAESAAAATAVELGRGYNPAVTEAGWAWYRAQRTWNYWTGTQWALWMDFTNSTAWIETANSATTGADDQLHLAAATYNWLGIYWTSSTTWSSSQLWYY